MAIISFPPAVTITIFLMFHVSFCDDNFYTESTKAVNNTGFGNINYNMTVYKPTCGWQLIIKSPLPLVSLSLPDQDPKQVDNYTFLTTNKDWKADLTYDHSVSSFQFHGSFGDDAPTLFITWYCVCTADTSDSCQKVYTGTTTAEPTTTKMEATTSTEEISTDIETTTEELSTDTSSVSYTVGQITEVVPTITSILYTAPAAVTTPSTTPMIWPSPPLQGSGSIYLKKYPNRCYLEDKDYTSIPKVRDVLDCATACVNQLLCTGINFRSNTKKCDVITKDSNLITQNLDGASSCTFYQVILRY